MDTMTNRELTDLADLMFKALETHQFADLNDSELFKYITATPGHCDAEDFLAVFIAYIRKRLLASELMERMLGWLNDEEEDEYDNDED